MATARSRKILKKQTRDGHGRHPGRKNIRRSIIRSLRPEAVQSTGGAVCFNREHPQAQKAAEFLFSCQSEQEYSRMLANQYATYYTGAILSLLIQADMRTIAHRKGFQWLLAMPAGRWGGPVPPHHHKFDRQDNLSA